MESSGVRYVGKPPSGFPAETAPEPQEMQDASAGQPDGFYTVAATSIQRGGGHMPKCSRHLPPNQDPSAENTRKTWGSGETKMKE